MDVVVGGATKIQYLTCVNKHKSTPQNQRAWLIFIYELSVIVNIVVYYINMSVF